MLSKADTYRTYGSLLRGSDYYGVQGDGALPYSENLTALLAPLELGGFTLQNRFAAHPMEGQDADGAGNPGDETARRYAALARGGFGLIWFEAVAVMPQARSNAHQIMASESTLSGLSALVESTRSAAARAGYSPVIIMQLAHSGRYSKPTGVPAPLCARGEDANLTDEYLAALPEVYARAAKYALAAGFDGVDIKCCHGYLLSELLAAYDRPGKYGGGFENRARLTLDIADAVNAALPAGAIRAARLNVYDGYEAAGVGARGFCEPEGGGAPDYGEAAALAGELARRGVSLLNVTMGSPYRNPDVSRPYRRGFDKPRSDAIAGLSRLLSGCAAMRSVHPALATVATGLSLGGVMAPQLAAGALEDGLCELCGFGRMSFAYPSIPDDIAHGRFDERAVCVCCGGCSKLKREGKRCYCVKNAPR